MRLQVYANNVKPYYLWQNSEYEVSFAGAGTVDR